MSVLFDSVDVLTGSISGSLSTRAALQVHVPKQATIDNFKAEPLEEDLQAYAKFVGDISKSLKDKVSPFAQEPKFHKPTSTTVLKLWEGVVEEVDGGHLYVHLRDRTGELPEHAATLEIESVAPQDRELIKPGAVFYWTVFRETTRGTLRTSNEIVFRRIPNWNKADVKKIMAESENLLSEFQPADRVQARP